MIFITGDTHGLHDIQKIIHSEELAALSADDFLIVSGDFGGVWDGKEHDEAVLDFYDSRKFVTLFVDGNHENFSLLKNKPIAEWNGGLIHPISNKVIHLMRGQIYTIEGAAFFTFGGAASIDKEFRTENITWWPEEEPSDEERETAVQNLEKHNFQVDYIITHAAPKSIVRNELYAFQRLNKSSSETEKFLDTILVLTKYKHWYCGHYHYDFDVKNRNFSVLYDRFLKIKTKA